MKRTSLIIGTTMLLLIMLTTPVLAASDQGLEWAVDVDNRFDFSFRYEDYYYEEFSKSFSFYFQVVSLGEIPSTITEVSSLLYPGIQPELAFYFSNGTEMGDWSAVLPQMVFPAGNWSLWTYLFNEIEPNPAYDYDVVSVADTLTTWSWSVNKGGSGMFGENGIVTFLKSDGALTYFRWTGLFENGSTCYEYEIQQLGFGLPLELTLALAGVAGILVVAVVVVLYRRR